jgi:membrane protein implicated in regulation of membrane protease activity
MILEMPEDSLAPAVLALGLAGVFTALILKAWIVSVASTVIVAVALIWWLWPRRSLREREPAHG